MWYDEEGGHFFTKRGAIWRLENPGKTRTAQTRSQTKVHPDLEYQHLLSVAPIYPSHYLFSNT